MHDAAVAWAETVLGEPVREVAPLVGGVTSTMLALTTHQGQEAVLRLMTSEPWRTHGAELTRREADAQRELASSASRLHGVSPSTLTATAAVSRRT